MTLSRRDLIGRAFAASAAAALAKAFGIRAAFGAPGTAQRNVVFVELLGGNDGLNSIVPFGVNGGAYYDHWRKKLAVKESKVLKVGGSNLGFHPALKELHARFLGGKVAVVQGVGYPAPNLSHDYSKRVWHTGVPQTLVPTGWLGRWLALYPEPSFPYASDIGIGSMLTKGAKGEVPTIGPLEGFTFPLDGKYWFDGKNRRTAFEKMLLAASGQPGGMQSVAQTGDALLELIDVVKTVPQLAFTGNYPSHDLSVALKIAARLINANLGMRFFHISIGNFDTHADQDQGGFHSDLLKVVSKGLDAFLVDLAAIGLADDTLVVVFSEFGRTLTENASGGTDHGTVNNVFVLGESLNPGFVTPHPSLLPDQLSPYGEMQQQADFRDVFGTVLVKWLGESPANLGTVFPGHGVADLGFVK